MSSLRQKRRSIAIINIIPLIDVLVVLIFFFLMTMHFKKNNLLNITPPEMESAKEKGVYEGLVVGVSKDGEYFVDSISTSKDNLKVSFEDEYKMNPDARVVVLADEEVPLKYMTYVMDTAMNVGLHQIKLETR